MKSAHRLAIGFLIVTCFAQGLRAQANGSITGHVTDSSKGVLKGAAIEVQPADAKTASDEQGAYHVNNLSPGTYTISITNVGFATLTKTVEVTAGHSVTVDAEMQVASVSDQVLVTGERPSGEAEQVNRQRTADNIMQVLTNEVITSLPNANIADAVGRLPSVTLERDEGEGKYVQVRGTEPRLTNATIDGVNVPSPESGVRQIKFDAIPSDIVESVEVNKTLQANMDGDGIGGSVNLVTKTATERPTISIFGLGGTTPIEGGRNNFQTTATLGKRFGTKKKFGLLGGFSWDKEDRGIDDVEPVPDLVNGTNQRYFDSMDIREYAYYRSRWGVTGSADYQLGPGSNIYLRGLSPTSIISATAGSILSTTTAALISSTVAADSRPSITPFAVLATLLAALSSEEGTTSPRRGLPGMLPAPSRAKMITVMEAVRLAYRILRPTRVAPAHTILALQGNPSVHGGRKHVTRRRTTLVFSL